MKSLFSSILCLFFILIFDITKANSITDNNILINYSTTINLEVLVYQNTTRLRIKNDTDIRLLKSSQLNVTVKVDIIPLVQSPNIKDILLLVDASFTSLIPVKIPPPPPPPSEKQKQYYPATTSYCFELDTYVLQNDSGFHSINFQLLDPINADNDSDCDIISNGECISNYEFAGCERPKGSIIDKKNVSIEVYDYYDFTLTEPKINIEESGIGINFCAYENDFDPYGNFVEYGIYISEDDEFDQNDQLLFNKSSELDHNPYDEQPQSCIDSVIPHETLVYFKGKKLFCVVDPENKVFEFDENNNNKVIDILPDLRITDIRVYKTPDNNVILSSTVTNTGNVTSELSRLDFYVDKHPRKFVARGTVPSLKPGKSYKVNSLVTWQYFSLVLSGQDLIVIADAEDDVIEFDESDNEKRFNIPRILNDSEQNPTLVTVSPNPFSSYVDFNYDVKYPNTDIKLSIYDQRGMLVYQTSSLHNVTGNFKFRIFSNQISGANGIYHYSFLLGRNNTIYFPSTGTIIKK